MKVAKDKPLHNLSIDVATHEISCDTCLIVVGKLSLPMEVSRLVKELKRIKCPNKGVNKQP